jgi:hypothetical protein
MRTPPIFRNLFSRFVGVAVVALLVGGSAFGEVPQDLIALKSKFEASPGRDTEAGRLGYINSLMPLDIEYMSQWIFSRKGKGALDFIRHEIQQHPSPKNYRPSPKLLLGDWQSPRHETRFTADGKWIMLPEGATHGRWKISNNKFFQNHERNEDKFESASMIYLLNQDYFVFGDSKNVFVEYRIPQGRTPKSPK